MESEGDEEEMVRRWNEVKWSEARVAPADIGHNAKMEVTGRLLWLRLSGWFIWYYLMLYYTLHLL
jgi:hypothetical protein